MRTPYFPYNLRSHVVTFFYCWKHYWASLSEICGLHGHLHLAQRDFLHLSIWVPLLMQLFTNVGNGNMIPHVILFFTLVRKGMHLY